MNPLQHLRQHLAQQLHRIRQHIAHRRTLRQRAQRIAHLRHLRHQAHEAFRIEEMGEKLAITHHGTPILLFLPDDPQQKLLLHLDILRRQAISHAQQHHCPL